MAEIVPGKIGIQQRVLPRYRAPFFETLALQCPNGLEIFAGNPRAEERIVTCDDLRTATRAEARNLHIGRDGLYMCWQRGYRRWLKEFDPDTLIVAADPRIITTYFAMRYMRARHRPVIGWGLGTLSEPGRADRLSVVSRIRSRFYRSFDAVIAYSSKAADDYRRAGVPEKNIFVARNAVSTAEADLARERFPPEGQEVKNWKTRNNLSKMTVIYVGRLVPGKLIPVLIQTCHDLGDDCDLVIVGDGPDRSALERLAAERFPRTRFLGHLEGDALSIALAGSDLFVLPGRGGLAIYEAMAHGKPVVVGQGDGTEADLVKNGENGLLIPPGDVGKLTDAIRSYIEHPERMRKEGQESRRIIKNEASIEKMTSAFVTALEFVS